MQSKFRFIKRNICFISFLAVCGLSVSCTTKDADSNSQNILVSDTSSTTGQLTINVDNASGGNESEVEVRLYPTYEDLERDIFIYSIHTNNSGDANFGFINIGNYYIGAVKGDLNNLPGDVVQVRSQKSELANITIR